MKQNLNYTISEINKNQHELNIGLLERLVDEKHTEATKCAEKAAFHSLEKDEDSAFLSDNEDRDDDKQSLITAKALHYETNINRNKLEHICNYYNIPHRKIKKPELSIILATFEVDPSNKEVVKNRLNLWNCCKQLKEDTYFSKYITIDL